MNKTELVSTAAEKAGISKKDAAKAVDALFEVISGALASGDKVQIIGFGSFEARKRAGRKGRNPQTGEEITIPPSTTVAFRPGKQLKSVVAD